MAAIALMTLPIGALHAALRAKGSTWIEVSNFFQTGKFLENFTLLKICMLCSNLEIQGKFETKVRLGSKERERQGRLGGVQKKQVYRNFDYIGSDQLF